MTQKLIERLSGTGQVLRDGTHVADVVYSLTVSQGSSEADEGKAAGTKSILGTVRLLNGRPFLFGLASWVLLLADGRKLPFVVRRQEGDDLEIVGAAGRRRRSHPLGPAPHRGPGPADAPGGETIRL